MDHTEAELDAIDARIRLAPPSVKKISNKDKIEALKPALLAAIECGHSPLSLSDLLASEGLKIAPRALSYLLQLTKPRRRRTTKSAQKPARGSSATPQ